MLPKLRWIAFALLLAAIAGCIKVDQTLALNRDGSGTLAIRYGMSEQTIAQIKAMEQMSQQGGEGIKMEQASPFEFDEAKVREEFAASKPDGVDLEAVTSEVAGGWKFIDLKLRFDDLRALKKIKIFKDSELRIIRDGSGNYRLVQKGPGSKEVSAGDARMQKQAAAMFAGLRIVNTLVLPSEVIATNATKVDGNRVSWIFDLAEDPEAISKLENTELSVTFSGADVHLPTLMR